MSTTDRPQFHWPTEAAIAYSETTKARAVADLLVSEGGTDVGSVLLDGLIPTIMVADVNGHRLWVAQDPGHTFTAISGAWDDEGNAVTEGWTSANGITIPFGNHRPADLLAACKYGGDHEATDAALVAAGYSLEPLEPADAAETTGTPEGQEPEHSGEWTDAAASERFARECLQNLYLYVKALGIWRWYDGTRWATDNTEAVHEVARRWVLAQVAALVAARAPESVVKAAYNLQAKARIDNLVTLARRIHGIAATPTEFDAYPYLLNVLNGTVDLRTGALRPHDPADRLTKIAGAAYHPPMTGAPK